MDVDWTPEVVPLGVRLTATARRLAEAHVREPGWLALASPLLRRTQERSAIGPDRFTRRESDRLPPGLSATAWTAGGADEPEVAPDIGRQLPADVTERLRPHLGAAAEAVLVHDDADADALARHHHADAVAFGREVYFARGRYQPDDQRGLGLIAHEAVHVAAGLDHGWQRPPSAARHDDEEGAAGAVERAVLRDRPPLGPATAPGGPATSGGAGAGPDPGPSGPPMRAATDRSVESPAPDRVGPHDLAGLREALVQDVMSRIRTDLERGG